MLKQCPVCGAEAHEGKEEYWGGSITTYPPVRLEYNGCCSSDCARTLYLGDRVNKVAGWLQGIGYHLIGEQVSFDEPTG